MKATINLYNEDCLPAMRKMADNQYSLAIVDPNYGINAEQGTNRASRKQFATKEYGWDDAPPSQEYFNELLRVSKNQIIWGGNYFLNYLGNTRSFIIWDKLNPDRCFADCEFAWNSIDGVARIFKPKRTQELNRDDGGKIHPTQKPVALYKWLLKNYAKPGNNILDTHFGSLSIGIACWDASYDLDAFEIDRDYFEAGKKRLENHKAQLQINYE